jgi:antitoxin VapB
MALNIKSAETDRLARELAALTGESITDAVTKAVAERLQRCRQNTAEALAARAAAIDAVLQRAWSRPKRDTTTPEDELLGYNERGTFD